MVFDFTDKWTVSHLQQGGHITWEMEERFKDLDGDGLVDLPNTKAEDQPSGLVATFRLDLSLPDLESIIRLPLNQVEITEKWYRNGVEYKKSYKGWQGGGIKHEFFDLEDEKLYHIEAHIEIVNPFKDILVKYMANTIARPDNIVILALGDSYSSGEGNPDRTRFGGGLLWADASDAEVRKSHADAHRSTTAWSAQAALELERSDPHSSVTYVNVAKSGAETDDVYGEGGQIDQASEILGDQKIDAIPISIGGNDGGFAIAVILYLIRSLGIDIQKKEVRTRILNGDWTTLKAIMPRSLLHDAQGLESLNSNLNKIRLKLNKRFSKIGQVYLMEYPNPGDDCKSINYHLLKLNFLIY